MNDEDSRAAFIIVYLAFAIFGLVAGAFLGSLITWLVMS